MAARGPAIQTAPPVLELESVAVVLNCVQPSVLKTRFAVNPLMLEGTPVPMIVLAPGNAWSMLIDRNKFVPLVPTYATSMELDRVSWRWMPKFHMVALSGWLFSGT